MMSNNVFAQEALKLSKKGYTTIPLNGKRPVTEEWQKLTCVTPDMIADWERQGYYRNIGMVTGSASNNIVVIDFDGMEGYELFKDEFPQLVDTLSVLTGSEKGMHCYYKVDLLPDSCGVMAIELNGVETVNIEFKSDGKQVVIPPSVHPDTGKQYIKAVDKPIMHLSDLSAVIAWAKGLAPREWEAPHDSTSDSEEKKLNQKLFDAVEAYFMSQEHKTRRNWINCSCPNHLAHKHGDKTFSFGYNPGTGAGNCFYCGSMNLKDILGYIGWDAKDYGGFYENPPKSAWEGVKYQQATPNGHTSQPAQGIPVITRTSILTAHWTRIVDYETPRTIAPVPFPFPALHAFKGLARVIKPGFLIGIVGTSGGGKTTLLESMVDSWLGYHVPSLVWSPEWDGEDFVARAVQRYGGATVEETYLHDLFVYEKQHGIKNGAGEEMSLAKQQLSSNAIRTLRGWESEVGYLNCPFMTVGHLQASIEATLASISFKPRVLVIDYVQLLLAMEENGDLTMYNLLMRIKAICKAFQLVGCIATQVTKESTRAMGAGKVLDGMSARFVNDDAFNLFVTVTPDMNPDGSYLPSAILNVAKNSMGQKGKRRVGVHWDRLLFDSTSHPNQNFGEESEVE